MRTRLLFDPAPWCGVYGLRVRQEKIGEVGRDGLSFPVRQLKGEVPVFTQLRRCFAHPEIQEAALAPRTNPFSQQLD